jgi:hypothetical protein
MVEKTSYRLFTFNLGIDLKITRRICSSNSAVVSKYYLTILKTIGTVTKQLAVFGLKIQFFSFLENSLNLIINWIELAFFLKQITLCCLRD